MVIQAVGGADGIQQSLDFGKIVLASLAQVIFGSRQALGDFMVAFHLAIQNTQRIPFVALIAIGTQFAQVRLDGFLQDFPVGGAAIGTSQAVDLEFEVLQPDGGKKFDQHGHHFGVHRRVGGTHGLDANLIKLAEASCLRPLVAEHGSNVIQFDQRARAVHFVFDVGTHHRDCAFRTERDLIPATVLEGVHLFFNDVGGFPNTPFEQVGVLENWNSNFLESILGKNTMGQGFHPLPLFDFTGEDIFNAFNAFDSHKS